MANQYDTVIYTNKGGKLIKMGSPKGRSFTNPETGQQHGPEDRCTFLITCSYGDWSGFRTLAKCVEQLEKLEELHTRDDYFFNIVERL